MEGLILTDSEQNLFQELFNHYDKENLGKVQGQRVAELFRSTQLPPERLEQIVQLCGAKRLGHFGRSQFYVALKLIAAAQAGRPLNPETLTGNELPLPRFVGQDEPDVVIRNGTEGYQPYLALNSSDLDDSLTSSIEPIVSPKDGRHWTSFKDNPEVLPGSDNENLLGNHTGGDSSDPRGHSSDEEDVRVERDLEEDPGFSVDPEDEEEVGEEVWIINGEQETYYKDQFGKMQPDLTSKITGKVAKEFFEKSKLPVQELSKIWQLSDIDKDGALSLPEFCTAMHLVVLRRNHIGLPDKLPLCLVPKLLPNLCNTTGKVEKVGPNPLSPPTDQLSPPNKEWTKFQESPTSTVSSPGLKPVNFDFNATSVEQDPLILHPVAVRLTPDIQNDLERSESGLKGHRNNPEAVLFDSALHLSGSQRPDENTSSISGPGSLVPILQGPKKEPPPPPPPRPRRNHTRSSSLDLNRIGKGEPHFLHSAPPVVPPRISPSAAGAFEVYRKPQASVGTASSSLSLDIDLGNMTLSSDVNRVQKSVPMAMESSGNVAQGSEPDPGLPWAGQNAAPLNHAKDSLLEKRELQVTIQMQESRNQQLSRLNNELDQELSEIMAERIALEIQLEHMKTSTAANLV